MAAVVAKYLIGRGWKNVETQQIGRYFYDKFSNQRNRAVKKANKSKSISPKRKGRADESARAKKQHKPNARARASKRTASERKSTAGEESATGEESGTSSGTEDSSEESASEPPRAAAAPKRPPAKKVSTVIFAGDFRGTCGGFAG